MSANDNQLKLPPNCHQDTLALYGYWLEKCRGRRMPARSDLDPIEMPRAVLPGICLVDVVPDERRYVYRLVGTGDVEVRGYDPTGKSVAEGYFAPTPANAIACYDRVVATKVPLLDAEPFMAPNGRYVTEETLFLPLSEDGINVNMVLAFSYCRHARPSNPHLGSERRRAS
ncbi:PAS domain-containing protein [Dongia deserti]|uniref:PAS domain-containing protein n=1 Tax=Dongia deserti TaxID=2268030 RepID=UPI000E64A946|nr:PAS domain-containing protein [Dongia deserti]